MSLIGSSGEMQFTYEEVMRHASNLYLNARMTIYTIDSSGVQIIDSLPVIGFPTSRLEEERAVFCARAVAGLTMTTSLPRSRTI